MATMTKMAMGDTVDGDKNGGDVNEDKTLCQIDIYLCILLFRRGIVVYHVKSLTAFSFTLYKSNQRSTFSL